MKILHVVPSYKPAYIYGGPVFSASSLCEALAGQGHEITVFTSTANGETDLPVADQVPEEISGVTVFYFQRWTKGNSNFTPRFLWRLFREIKNYDAVHIHSWWNLIVVPATVIAILQGVRPVVSVRGTMSPYTFTNTRGSRVKWLFHQLIGKPLLQRSLIHVTSTKEWAECKKRIGDFEGYILPNFVDIARADQIKRSPPENIFRIITISRIHPVKNLELVFQSVAAMESPCELHLLGEGEEAYVTQLKELSIKLKLSDHIYWHGQQDKPGKFALLNKSHLFVQLSFTENFGNSIIEAASAGVPVLVSNTTGAADYVENLELGWVVPLEEQVVKKTLRKIISDRLKREAIRHNGPEVVRENFSGKKLAIKYLEAYGQRQMTDAKKRESV